MKIARKGAIVGSILNGPSHEQGGIKLAVGGVPTVEAEGGEVVMTKGVSKDPSLLAAASALNVAGGGIPLVPTSFAETGGLVAANQAADHALQAAQIANAFKNVKIVASFEEFLTMQQDYDNTVDLTTI